MRYVVARLTGAAIAGAVLAVIVALAVLLPKCEGPGPHPFNQAAHTTTVRPPSQVVDGLYKSLVVALPGGRVLVCILTRLPRSLPGFTIPPEYTCVRPGEVYPTPDGQLPPLQRITHA